MTNPATLHAQVLALLGAITHVTAYDGTVPDQPPADAAGYVYPYTVLWSGAGGPGVEQPLAGQTDLIWTFQVQVAGGNTDRVLQAVHLVRSALRGQVLAGTVGGIIEEPLEQPVRWDYDTAPPRAFVPLRFYTLTA